MLLLLYVSATPAQVQVTAVSKPSPVTDPDIIIYNSFFDRENNTWGWIYDPTVSGTAPYRDIGQTFTPSTAFFLDKIYIALSPASDQNYLDACENAPIHVDILQFNSIVEMEPPAATISSQSGNMPAVMVYGTTQFLEFDIQNVALQAGKIYAFLFKFDFMKANRYLKLVKSEDGDYYSGGKLLYTEFNGTDGRQNITIYKWKHAGGNPNRDLHFWLKKGMPSAVPETNDNLPVSFALQLVYPNPFNSTARLGFTIDALTHVKLEIINLRGMVVATLVDQSIPAGVHKLEWDGSLNNGTIAPSGIYYCRLKCRDRQVWQKLTLLR